MALLGQRRPGRPGPRLAPEHGPAEGRATGARPPLPGSRSQRAAGRPQFAARIHRLIDGRLAMENRDLMGPALVTASLLLAGVWACLVLFTPDVFAGVHRAAEAVLAALH